MSIYHRCDTGNRSKYTDFIGITYRSGWVFATASQKSPPQHRWQLTEAASLGHTTWLAGSSVEESLFKQLFPLYITKGWGLETFPQMCWPPKSVEIPSSPQEGIFQFGANCYTIPLLNFNAVLSNKGQLLFSAVLIFGVYRQLLCLWFQGLGLFSE